MQQNHDSDVTVLAPSATFPNALRPGTVIFEKFRIISVLGQGGFGIVYLAFDESLHRNIALKEYMPSQIAGRVDFTQVSILSKEAEETFEVGMKSFINEARLQARFDHPALIRVYDSWEANGTAYMAMPYYDKPTLKQLLKAEHASLVEETSLRRLLSPLLEALELLHDQRCYHRDIAPDNILMLTNTQPLLLDFGAARHVVNDKTQALTAFLKPGYAPIEQYADSGDISQGPWTDLYALAAVMYFMITDKMPQQSISRIMQDNMVPLTVSAEGRYSPTFLAALDAALAVRPENRPQTVAAFRALLGLAEVPPEQAHVGATTTVAGAPLPSPNDGAGSLRSSGPATAPRTKSPASPAGGPQQATEPAPHQPVTGRTTHVPHDEPEEEPKPFVPGKPGSHLLVAGGALVVALALGLGILGIKAFKSKDNNINIKKPPVPASASASASASAVLTPPPPICTIKFADDSPACPDMVKIAGGPFQVGSGASDPQASSAEFGGAPITIAAFEISAYEVTNELWQFCVAADACPPLRSKPGKDSAKLPVTNISWDDAQKFTAWLSTVAGATYRLPTEAEWEFAARAGASTPFPWGDKVGADKAHCGECDSHLSFKQLAPVGSYKAVGNLYDMVGNAQEWVEDCWTSSHADPAPDIASCTRRVQKGGAYDSIELDVRPAARTFGERSSKDPHVGFRVSK